MHTLRQWFAFNRVFHRQALMDHMMQRLGVDVPMRWSSNSSSNFSGRLPARHCWMSAVAMARLHRNSLGVEQL